MFPFGPDYYGRAPHPRNHEATDVPTSAAAPDREALPLGGTRRAWWADNDRLDRLWLRANVAAWLFGLILALPYAMAVVGPVCAAEGSAIFTLFFVTIPSRVALNLIVRERRRRYFKETVVCCVTFCILCWVAYSILRYPDPFQ